MKNALNEKKSKLINDEPEDGKVIKSQSSRYFTVKDSESRLVQIFKYSLVIAACIAIPFSLNFDNSFKEMFGFFDKPKSNKTETIAEDNFSDVFLELEKKNEKANLEITGGGNVNPEMGINVEGLEDLYLIINRSMNEALAEVDWEEINAEILAAINNAQLDQGELAELQRLSELSALAASKIENDNISKEAIQNQIATLIRSIGESVKTNVTQDNPSESTIDYMLKLKEELPNRKFQLHEVQSYIAVGLSIKDLKSFDSNGLLDKYKFFEIVGFINSGMSSDEILKWSDSNLAQKLKFFEIIGYHEKGYGPDDLSKWNKSGYLNELKHYEVISYMENGVTPEILDAYKKEGLFKRFKFYEIVEFQTKGIPLTFIKDLQKKGILSDLKHYEIVNLYLNN